MLQHILVGLDGSPLAESILPYVSTLAKALEGQVTLLHVIPGVPDWHRSDFYRFLSPLIKQEETEAYGYLRRVTERLVEAGITVQSRVSVGDAATEILTTGQQAGMDLIALATHGRSGLRRWVYGSTAEKVLHTTYTPLLLIRPTEEQPTPSAGLTQVVIPLDGSPVAETAIPLAEELAKHCGVPLVLFRVIEILPLTFVDPMSMAGGNYQVILDGLEKAAQEYLDQVATTLRRNDFSVQIVTAMGGPADKIVRYTHDHPGSLVVMATHGRTGVTDVVLGSVARRVVLHGNTPTLMVRPRAVTSEQMSPAPQA
jgi:nucleotide-binding universal stress UspA family protein